MNPFGFGNSAAIDHIAGVDGACDLARFTYSCRKAFHRPGPSAKVRGFCIFTSLKGPA